MKKVYKFPKKMSGAKKKKIIADLTGKWVEVITTDKSYAGKGKLMGLDPDSKFIYVGVKLMKGSNDEFVLVKTFAVITIRRIKVLSQKPSTEKICQVRMPKKKK